MKLPSNVPIFSLLPRIGWLLLVFIVSAWACNTEIHFSFLGKWRLDPELGGIWAPATPMDFCGPLLWMVPLGIGSYIMTVLTIHLHFRETIDSDINSGKFVEYWKTAPTELRLRLIFVSILAVFIGLCIIYAGLARA